MPPPRLFGLRRAPSDQSSGVLDVAVDDARSDHGASSVRGGAPKPHTPRLMSSDGSHGLQRRESSCYGSHGLQRRESSGSGASPARGSGASPARGSGASPARGLMLDEVTKAVHSLLHPPRLLSISYSSGLQLHAECWQPYCFLAIKEISVGFHSDKYPACMQVSRLAEQNAKLQEELRQARGRKGFGPDERATLHAVNARLAEENAVLSSSCEELERRLGGSPSSSLGGPSHSEVRGPVPAHASLGRHTQTLQRSHVMSCEAARSKQCCTQQKPCCPCEPDVSNRRLQVYKRPQITCVEWPLCPVD